MSSKRKQPPAAASAADAAADPPAKIHASESASAVAAPARNSSADKPVRAAAAAAASPASAPRPVEMSEEQRYMQAAYSVGRRTMPQKPAALDEEVAKAVDWSEAHRNFVNHGLAQWRLVRSAWIAGRDDKARAKRAAAAAAAGADAASSNDAAATPSAPTALPHSHAPLNRARSRSKYADTSDEEHVGGTDESDEFVAAASDDDDDDDPNQRDINADVPAILEAREHYQPFVPRVKLSHMVDILNCIWEEEED